MVILFRYNKQNGPAEAYNGRNYSNSMNTGTEPVWKAPLWGVWSCYPESFPTPGAPLHGRSPGPGLAKKSLLGRGNLRASPWLRSPNYQKEISSFLTVRNISSGYFYLAYFSNKTFWGVRYQSGSCTTEGDRITEANQEWNAFSVPLELLVRSIDYMHLALSTTPIFPFWNNTQLYLKVRMEMGAGRETSLKRLSQ